MLQAAQSTAVQHTNPNERLSDFGENAVQKEPLVQNADQAITLVLEQGTDSPTTSVHDHDQDMEKETLPAFADHEQDSDVLSRVVKLPQPPVSPSPPETLHALQEWEGYVTEINDTEFTARLIDLTAKATYAGEEANIPLDEILEDDAAKLQVGSIFRWVIGYERTAGAKKRVSYIVFRDLPAITKTDLRDGEEWAHKIMAAFEQ
ncbi:MAG: hypothetical protein F4049_03185 [Gemmatimonadetes bacterium]|nr:hypothetical protein [Gemmatimonadota bacterium]